jgi:O-antigen ligase
MARVEREKSIELINSRANLSTRARVARLLSQIIFFALLILFILTAIPYGTVEPWWVAVYECCVFMLGVLWFIEGLLSGEWHIEHGALMMPLLAIVVLALCQIYLPLSENPLELGGANGIWRMISADPAETRRFAWKLLSLILTGQLLLRYTSNQRRLRALIFVIIGIAVASALFGLLRQSLQRDSTGFLLPLLQPAFGYGQFVNYNHFAFLMEMALGLILGLVIGGGVHRKHLLIYLAMTIPIWTALILSRSRGGILSMLSQLIFLALMFKVVRRRKSQSEWHDDSFGWLWQIFDSFVFRVALILCVIIVVSVGVIWIGGEPVVSRFESETGDVSANIPELKSSFRQATWNATWQLIKAHPVAGVGFGGYWVAITQYHNASGEFTPQQAHNDYLELMASGGLIGFALFLWFVVVWVKRAKENLYVRNQFQRSSCLGALTGLFSVAIHSFVDFGLHITINALIFTALIIVSIVKLKDEEFRSREIVSVEDTT